MSLEIVEPQGDSAFTTLRFSGRLDAASAEAFKQRLVEVLKADRKEFVGDFAGLRYISSGGLNLLIFFQREVTARGGEFRIAAVQSYVKEILDLTGYSKVFRIYETVEDATGRS